MSCHIVVRIYIAIYLQKHANIYYILSLLYKFRLQGH